MSSALLTLSVIYYRTITSDAGHLQVLGPLSTLLEPGTFNKNSLDDH